MSMVLALVLMLSRFKFCNKLLGLTVNSSLASSESLSMLESFGVLEYLLAVSHSASDMAAVDALICCSASLCSVIVF